MNTERQQERQTDGHKYIHTYRQTDRQTGRLTYIQPYRTGQQIQTIQQK